MDGETVWLSQAQMAELFGTKSPAITKHLNNIYKCKELLEESTCSILEHMGNDRFLIIDDEVYLFGASLKDAGKKLFAYIRMQETSAAELISNIR